jgi:hypothetical protein
MPREVKRTCLQWFDGFLYPTERHKDVCMSVCIQVCVCVCVCVCVRDDSCVVFSGR